MQQNPETFHIPPDLNLRIDFRPINTLHALSALKRYLEVMEQQMPEIQLNEISRLESERPVPCDEEDYSIFSGYVSHLENLFEEDIVPSMRYSSIVLLHTVFETQLHYLCNGLQRERNIAICLSDLGGSPLDQARDYCKKFAGPTVSGYPEWNELRNFQKVRDCIVHNHGFLNSADNRHKKILEFARKDHDLEIDEKNRIIPTAKFCFRHHSCVESFLRRFMTEIGWNI